jgi:hypothetical protein
MNSDTKAILKQFTPIDRLYREIVAGTDDAHSDRVSTFCTHCVSTIRRIAGENSSYAHRVAEELAKTPRYDHEGRADLPGHIRPLYGIMQALKADVRAGYLSTLRELIHADVFSDFLETAQYFLDAEHKDPAAVMAGGVLEQHLRQLCRKNGIDTEAVNSAGVMKAKMGDALNTELYRANVYGLLEQKQIVAWLDIRNKAAHGKYEEYAAAHVGLFIQGLRDFIMRFPA